MKKKNYYLKAVTGVYLITDRETGKQYVGQSRDCAGRWAHHLAGASSSALAKELRKRPQDFTFQVLQTCSLEDLDLLEGHWIEEAGTMEPAGYNRQSAPGSSRKGNRKGQEPPEPTPPPIIPSDVALISESTEGGKEKVSKKPAKRAVKE